MPSASLPLTSCLRRLDLGPDAFGALRESQDRIHDTDGLREELQREGYLFLRNHLAQESVQDARQEVIRTIQGMGLLDERHPPLEAVAAAGGHKKVLSVQGHEAVRHLVNSAPLLSLFDRLMGGEARSLGHIWGRIMGPGTSTPPHCDIVYMGRGTQTLYTCWIPLGNVPRNQGALMILERSHQIEKLRHGYCSMDVDANNNARKLRFRHWGFFRGGQYTKKPDAAQREFKRRWLSADFHAGDIILFSTFLLHGTLDNQTPNIRLSVDARYQLAADPADERWSSDATPTAVTASIG